MNLEGMLFQNWSGIVRTVLVGSLAYATLVCSCEYPENEPSPNWMHLTLW